MKTIEEHNKERREAWELGNQKIGRSDVECPQCSSELFINLETMLMSSPPRRDAFCKSCNFSTTILA